MASVRVDVAVILGYRQNRRAALAKSERKVRVRKSRVRRVQSSRPAELRSGGGKAGCEGCEGASLVERVRELVKKKRAFYNVCTGMRPGPLSPQQPCATLRLVLSTLHRPFPPPCSATAAPALGRYRVNRSASSIPCWHVYRVGAADLAGESLKRDKKRDKRAGPKAPTDPRLYRDGPSQSQIRVRGGEGVRLCLRTFATTHPPT